MKPRIFALLIALLSLLTTVAFADVCINEICASNSKYVPKNGEYYDFVELYNDGDVAASLARFSLSDSKDKPTRFIFPDSTIIPAHGFLVVYATGNDVVSGLEANFKISAKKLDTIFLFDASGSLRDSLTLLSGEDDVSTMRCPDGSDKIIVAEPSPLKSNYNAKPIAEKKSVISFSTPSGFYSDPFDLALSSEADTIYYTLDGSDPDKSSLRYTGSIKISDATPNAPVYALIKDVTISEKIFIPNENNPIDKAVVVRAAVYNASGKRSDIQTCTYFVGFDGKSGYDDMAIVSLVTDPDNLFDYEKGIYVKGKTYENWLAAGGEASTFKKGALNYTSQGSDWERPAHLEFYESDHSLALSQEVGIRIRGGASRGSQQKSFNIYSRKSYDGNTKLMYDFFGTGEFCENAVLYNGANGWNSDKIREVFATEMTRVGGLDVATYLFRPCAVFLDGEYWGMYYIREKYDEDYFTRNYGVDGDKNVIMIKNGELEIGNDEDGKAYSDAVYFVSNNDMTLESNYKKACELFDMDSFADYFAMRIYLATFDWPHNNFALWRTKTDDGTVFGDTKWRWIQFDADSGMNGAKNAGGDSIPEFDTFKWTIDKNRMFAQLIRNEDFKRRYVASSEYIGNILFAPGNTDDVIDRYFDEFSSQMVLQYRRFSSNTATKKNLAAYYEKIRSFFYTRNKYAFSHIKNHFGFTAEPQTFLLLGETVGGKILVNGEEVKLSYFWEGRYFSDKNVTITAVPDEGYRFCGWEGDALPHGYSDSKTVTFAHSAGDSIVLMFNYVEKT